MPRDKLKTGIEMYYEVTGKGDPLILIMGTGIDHSFWAKQIPEFSLHYACITPDNRGTGQSDKPEGEWTVHTFAEDVRALMDEVGIDRAHVGGLSLGGAITLDFGISFPERVKSLILYNTWARTDPYLALEFETAKYLAELGDREKYLNFTLWRIFSRSFATAENISQLKKKSLEYPFPTPLKMVVKHWEADLKHDVLGRLNEIALPTLIITGEQDIVLPAYYSEVIRERIPHAEYCCLKGDGSSHLQIMERTQEINTLTLKFLQKQE
ncbi:MAG: alpha/beta fold hydrolase [Candidatus Bathyarchaeia archaeon]